MVCFAGFQFNQQMNGGGGGGGGAFYQGGFAGFIGGGGAQMSDSTPQTRIAQQRERQTGGETGAPLQQQLFQIGEMMHDGKCGLLHLQMI